VGSGLGRIFHVLTTFAPALQLMAQVAGPMQASQGQQLAYQAALQAGVPPDPRQCGPLCVEVDHGQVLALASLASGHAVLRNSASGEQVQFPLGQEVTLHLKGKRAFVALPDGSTQWANKLMKTSVWETVADSKRFLLTRHPDGHQLHWQEEWQLKTQLHKASFKVEGREFSMTALNFVHGRHGCACNVFWDLESVKAALALQGLSPAHLARWLRTGHAKTWARLLENWGCTAADELQLISDKATTGNDIIVARRTVSTKALLLLAAHWSRTFENPADRTSASSLLDGMVLHAAAAGARLKGSIDNALLRAKGSNCFDFAMVNGMLASSDLKTCKLWQSFPAPARSKATFLNEESFKVTELLVYMGRFGCMFGFLSCLASSLAESVESQCRQLPCAAVLDELTSEAATPHTRKDPEVRRMIRRQLLEKNIGKNYRNVGKIAKAMGKDLGLASYQNHIDCHRYWLAACRAMASEVQVAMASDASRFGGKDRLCSAIMGLSTGVVVWAPPQDPGVPQCRFGVLPPK
jgi:hypothetical protein